MRLFSAKKNTQEFVGPINQSTESFFTEADLNRWETTLKEVDRKLENLLRSSEMEFLAIGNKLQKYSKQARLISDTAHQSADYFAGEEVKGAMEELLDILDRIQRYVEFGNSRTDERKEVLLNAFQQIVNLHEPLSDFKRMVKKLNVLGVTTNIENARLPSGQGTFHNLAESVNSLSKHIEMKSVEIETRSRQIEMMGNDQFGTIQDLESERARQASSSIQSIQSCLSNVSDKQVSFKEVIERVSLDTAEIAQKIGDVVHSVQFHDITRQMIEHVQTAVRKQLENLEKLPKNGSASPENRPQSEDNILQLNDICALQSAQLKKAKEDIVQAMDTIRTSLTTIIGNVADVSDEIGRVNSTADTGNKICMDDMKNNIRFVTSSIHTFVDSNVQLNQTLKNVFDVIQEMGGYADDIRVIGADIELTALNGLISAARLGHEGAALSVLADAIQKLSGESRDKVMAISDILKQIVFLTKDIVTEKNIEESAESAIMMVVEIESELNMLMNNLSDINDKVKQKISHVQAISAEFAGDVSVLIDDLSVDSVYQSVLTETMTLLESITEDFRKYGFVEVGISSIEELNVLSGNYTMQQERDVHQAIIDNPESRSRENRMDYSGTPIADNDFGENVELF